MIPFVLWLGLITVCGQSPSLEKAQTLERQGDFKGAARLLSEALGSVGVSSLQQAQIRFELDRLERIRKDYPFTKDSLFVALKKSVRDLTGEEFERWIGEGRFDARTIDGEQRFMVSSVSNLYFRYPELEPRRMPPRDRSSYERRVLEAARSITKAAGESGKPYVLPKQFNVAMSVTVESNAVPPGEVIRAWLPIPREYPFQSGFKPGETSSRVKHLDAATSVIRSVHLEQPAATNGQTEFKIEYDYTRHGVRFDLNPERVRPCNTNDPALKPFLQEAPHVVFTPQMQALSKQIAGGVTNDYVKARKFYDWIAENIKYSYALEYSTIRNISEYCRSKGYGDCGQEALLFITLCRMNGIPARWQSGWSTIPGGKTIHDWTEIYLEPYGWMPVDPYMGIWATRYSRKLSDSEKREVRDFYFGGLDQWRMIANSDHNQNLVPAKNAFRSDTVDFQRGELEWGTNNLYYDQFDYELTVREVGSE
ncbi:MAG TPA: transglutaminase-like domain-containing protein [Verrucomicrobiae bacterium]|nr:transglutaminase-like domain-containing protein [Verrucomicrobiae bacterium]